VNKTLEMFVKIWTGFAILINLIAIIGLFIGAGGFWAGLASVREIYSPFNVINYFFEVILISPALGAHYWLRKRQSQQRPAQC
jgi:hypothetical protein